MRILASLFFALPIVLQAQASWAANHTVLMKSISYDPKSLEVEVGDEVDFNNVSYTEHSATAEGAFDTGMILPKKISKKIKFSEPGTFQYHCSMHGKTMSGTIVVKP